MNEKILERRKKEAKKISKQLCYHFVVPEIFDRIEACRTMEEINRLLRTCRQAA